MALHAEAGRLCPGEPPAFTRLWADFWGMGLGCGPCPEASWVFCTGAKACQAVVVELTPLDKQHVHVCECTRV